MSAEFGPSRLYWASLVADPMAQMWLIVRAFPVAKAKGVRQLEVYRLWLGFPPNAIKAAEQMLSEYGWARTSPWERVPERLLGWKAWCDPIPAAIDAELEVMLGRRVPGEDGAGS